MAADLSLATAPEQSCPKFFRLPRQRRGWLKALMILVAAVMTLQVLRVLVGANFHTVVPGLAYRGAQQSPAGLEKLVLAHGIRTVINLRGNGWPLDWYQNQCRTLQNLGVNHEDICLSATRLPAPQELRQLIDIFDRADRPLFLHCRRGSDRTGLACAVLMLLRPEGSLADARAQLCWRYGHVAVAKTGYQDAFLDLYENWLAERSLQHAPDIFRGWVENDYRGGWCQYEVEEFRRLPAPSPGSPVAFKIRVRNVSARSWHFEPHHKAGVHVGFRVFDGRGALHLEERTGLVQKVVKPGETFATVVVIPPRLKAGAYRLQVDMVEEDQAWFYQVGGSVPLEEELLIRE